MTSEELTILVKQLVALPTETEWIELKYNNTNPDKIGQTISALANSAALERKPAAYIIWGVENNTHKIIGTSFKPRETKKGDQELESWLINLLSPRINLRFHEGNVDNCPVVVLEIQPANNSPVHFQSEEYIRIGSYVKKLREYPEKERALWKLFETISFEDNIAVDSLSSEDVLNLLDCDTYFKLMNQPRPSDPDTVLSKLESEKILKAQLGNKYAITNVGAILFATDLRKFNRLSRKAIRVIHYKGIDKTETLKEQEGHRGYAVGFSGLIRYISDQLPQNEQIDEALRKEVRVYPEIAIRELVANALIHQDFSVTGAGPLVEIYSDRMEITNPGNPLIDTLRFIDEPPRSRNEQLAALARRMKICEERGSGIDKVVKSVEMFQLPAPDFRKTSGATIAVLFGPRKFSQMTQAERIRACYQHACLLYVSGRRMTNTTLRKRLGLKDTSYPLASRIIKDTIGEGLIKLHVGTSKSQSKRDASYIPFWS
ncbi:MAG: ATP-binding protein [Bdellovibrionota bacterium]